MGQPHPLEQMMENWKEQIAIGWLVKPAMMEADIKKVFPYHLPEVTATESQILAAEKSLGHHLDERYKEFLRRANGWLAFWHDADLFGTNDLIEGPRHVVAQHSLSLLDEGVIKSAGLARCHLLPICVTGINRDLFVITCPSSPAPGLVVWFAGEEVERYSTLDDFFLAKIEYGRHDVEWLKNRQKQ